MHRALWTCVAAVFLTLVMGVRAQARVAVVETESGQTFEGELISETDQTVILLISGIETPVKRSNIKSITLKKSGEEIFKERRAQLKNDDLDGRFALAYDMYEMGELSLAKQETESLLERFPDSEKAQRLDDVVADAIKLQEDRIQEPAVGPADAAPPVTDQARPNGGRLDPQTLREQQLTEKEINLIRLWELPADLSDLKPRIIIPRETIETVLDEYADREEVPKGRREQNAFRTAEGWEQLPVLFAVRARELYPTVRVIEDPPAMKTYRSEILPLYINGYFSETFGRGAVEGLSLFGGRGERVRAAYTDFYILHKFQQGNAYMIDRDKPEESLLVQWGLPRDQAIYKAPDVPGWRPFFTGRDDPQFDKIVEWIDSLYKTVDYGISYSPPAPDQIGHADPPEPSR
jgi:hypothetical protein